MTQQEKQILLQDLCARLPYSVKVKYFDMEYPYGSEPVILTVSLLKDRWENIQDVKPYLRSMSSMTEEEENELVKAAVVGGYNDDSVLNSYIITDWLNAHYFDFRNLIGKGLAIDCTDLNIY